MREQSEHIVHKQKHTQQRAILSLSLLATQFQAYGI